ncbi:MAG: Vps62-related protein [Clostridia bacterium]|nr:Vps62-related protein [Clostridia bacterium]
MKRKKALSKKKIVLLVVAALIVLGIAVILIVNSTYIYDPTGSKQMLAEGQSGVLTLQYNGADGKPESEQITYESGKPLALPAVSKKGYFFSGWMQGDLYIGTEITLRAKEATLTARFDKDYTAVTSPCAVYSEDGSFLSYKAGKFPTVNTKAADVYLDGGYKLTVYSKENFEGKETNVYYSGKFSGFIGSMKVEAVKSDSIAVTALDDAQKITLLKTFAPRIWWEEDEQYFASSVEFAAENMEKVMGPTGNLYYLKELNSPRYTSDFFRGDLENAKAYAFAVEKEFKYLDLCYFYYAPFNLGKQIAGMEFGDHVGDWEHVSVRLLKETNGGKLTYRPVIVDYSAHFMRNYIAWDEVETVENTHPVAFTARGSHGMWKDSGAHIYADAFVVQLKDYCSEGTAWDLWEEGKLETYTYDALTHEGKGIGTSEWKRDFDIDCGVEGGGVTIWGNMGWRTPIQIYPRMDSAPSGPQHKESLNDYYTINGQND